MADPLSIIASLLAVATAGVQSTRSLKETVKRYQTRDVTLRKLLDELGDAENILNALSQLLQAGVPEADMSMAALLHGPTDRCSKMCHDFEEAMKKFSNKAKTNIVDWTKMEFMRGDINQFMANVASYKATISVGLGVLTMRTVRLSHQALEEYDEMVKNTTYELNLRLQRIDDRMETLAPASGPAISHVKIDLNSERQVTEQCLRICENAKYYFETQAGRDSTLREPSPNSFNSGLHRQFEAQLLTRQALNENQASLVKTITRLRERLESVVFDGDSGDRRLLQEDIQTSKQCLEVCKLASSEVANQKIHIIGEVVADGDSDHVVVTTLADMFSVGKSISKNKSALLVGSMSDEALMQLSHDRYNSRFGVASSETQVTQGRTTVLNSEASNLNSSHSYPRNENRQPEPQGIPPSSNETRKRVTDAEGGAKSPRNE